MTPADVAATDVFDTAVQAADDAWNTAASGAEAAYDRATVAADQAWTDAESTAWDKYTSAVNDLESAYQAAIDDALAAWTTATKDAENVWDAAQTDAENEFISDATAAIDDYISRITTAIDEWTKAESDAQNAYDLAMKTAIDAWNTSEAVAQSKYDTAMSLALSKWNTTNDSAYAIYSAAYDNALSLTDTSLSLDDNAMSPGDDGDLSFVCYVDPNVPAMPAPDSLEVALAKLRAAAKARSEVGATLRQYGVDPDQTGRLSSYTTDMLREYCFDIPEVAAYIKAYDQDVARMLKDVESRKDAIQAEEERRKTQDVKDTAIMRQLGANNMAAARGAIEAEQERIRQAQKQQLWYNVAVLFATAPLGGAGGPTLGVGFGTAARQTALAAARESAGALAAEARAAGSAARSAAPEGSQLQTLYRGERSSRIPVKVFEEGIPAKGNNADLEAHVAANLKDSNFVATSIRPAIAKGFAGKNGYLYVIRTKNGIDVNATLGSKSPFPEQFEVAIPGGVLNSEVIGAYPMKNGEIAGPFVRNPNYKPPQ